MKINPCAMWCFLAVLAACADVPLPPDSDAPATGSDNVRTGVVVAALNVPARVLCVRLRILQGTAPPLSTMLFGVAAGQDLELVHNRVTTEGTLSMSGEAFDVACPTNVNFTSPSPTWVAEPVAFQNTQGATARVQLFFQINTGAITEVEWDREIVQIHSDGYMTVATDISGDVWAWGGKVGTRPVNLNFQGAKEAKTAGGHVCVLRGWDNSLWCWIPLYGYDGPNNPYWHDANPPSFIGYARQFSMNATGVYWVPIAAAGELDVSARFTGMTLAYGSIVNEGILALLSQ